jgi:hypothetical protein
MAFLNDAFSTVTSLVDIPVSAPCSRRSLLDAATIFSDYVCRFLIHDDNGGGFERTMALSR